MVGSLGKNSEWKCLYKKFVGEFSQEHPLGMVGSRSGQRDKLSCSRELRWPHGELWNWDGHSELCSYKAMGHTCVHCINQPLDVDCPQRGDIILGKATCYLELIKNCWAQLWVISLSILLMLATWTLILKRVWVAFYSLLLMLLLSSCFVYNQVALSENHSSLTLVHLFMRKLRRDGQSEELNLLLLH